MGDRRYRGTRYNTHQTQTQKEGGRNGKGGKARRGGKEGKEERKAEGRKGRKGREGKRRGRSKEGGRRKKEEEREEEREEGKRREGKGRKGRKGKGEGGGKRRKRRGEKEGREREENTTKHNQTNTQNTTKHNQTKPNKRGQPRIELGASPTRRANHTTRPLSQSMTAGVLKYILKACALNAVPPAIRATLMATVHVATYPRATSMLRLAGTPAAGRLDSPRCPRPRQACRAVVSEQMNTATNATNKTRKSVSEWFQAECV